MFPLDLPSAYYNGLRSKRFNKDLKIFNFYGITEQSCWSFIYECKENDLQIGSGSQLVPIGQPVWGTEFTIRDDQLYLGGKRRCTIDSEKGQDWYPTGDKVTVIDNKLFIKGRINRDQIKINGKTFCRLHVKQVIRERFQLQAHVVFDGKRVYLFVITDSDIPELKIRIDLKKLLPGHYKFDRVVVTPKINLTNNHKVDECKFITRPVSLDSNKTNLDNSVLEFLRVRSLLRADYSNDIFSNLGLDSLDIMQMSAFLMETLPSLSRYTDQDKLFQTLVHCPIGRLWDTITEGKPYSSVPKPINCAAERLSIVSRVNMSLCVDSSPTIFTTTSGVPCYCVGSHAGELYCGTLPTSTQLWRCQLPDRIESSPCYSNHHIVVGCYDGSIYALDAELGIVEYVVRTGDQVKCSPRADEHGAVYCGSHDGCLYKITAAQLGGKWEYEHVSVKVDSKPILASVLIQDRTVIVCTLSGRVTALTDDLETTWKVELRVPIFSSPTRDRDHVTVALVTGSILQLRSSDGELLRRCTAGGLLYSSLLLHNDSVFVGCHDRKLYCLEAELAGVAWAVELSSEIFSSPRGIEEGIIVAITTDGVMSAIGTKTGRVVSSFSFPGQVFSTPAVWNQDKDVFLVVGCRDNYSYVLKWT